MFTDIRRRHKDFGGAYIVILNIYDLDEFAQNVVTVDVFAEIPYKADYVFCHIVTRRGFAAENERHRLIVAVRIIFDFYTSVDYLQRIQKFAFIFVHTLYLHVENRVRVNFFARFFKDVICKVYLVFFLYLFKS